MNLDTIISQIKDGDQRAFKTLFDRYSSLFKGICYRYTGNNHESNDVLQEAFIKIFKNIDNYTGKGNFEGWMKRIVVNCCLDYVRKERKPIWSSEEPFDQSISENWDVPISEMTAKEIVSVVDRLPDGYKVVFNLSVFDGYSHKEIAETLGISESASRSQLAKAKKKLQSELIRLKIVSARA